MEHKINHSPSGVMELERPDGWHYKLHGVHLLESMYDVMDMAFSVRVFIADVSDQTLASVKVLRDAFPDAIIKIETNH